MPYNEEADTWDRGSEQALYYAEYLAESERTPFGRTGPPSGADDMKKIVSPEEMPWEETPHGRIKHMLNERLCEELDVPIHGTDLYMQELPPGESSGKHRHMSEELVYVLEGRGYDRHWDADISPTADGQRIEWRIDDEPKRFDWERGDVVYIPMGSAHQHFNRSEEDSARFVSITNRAYTHLGYGFRDLEQLEPAEE